MGSMAIEWLVVDALACLYAGWILLPLIPAVLIYRLFPDTTVAVSGPLAGLTVKAGGAFGAYLIVFAVVSVSVINSATDTITSLRRQFWVVKADVKLLHADGRDYPHPEALLRKLRVVTPEIHRFESFQATLKLEENEGGLPTVTIEIPNFGEQAIPLRSMSEKIRIDPFKKTIELKEPIVIRELSLGGGSAPTITQVSRSESASAESSDRPR